MSLLVVDALDDQASWTGSGSITVQDENQLSQFIAGLNTKSLIFKFPAGSLNGTMSKSGLSIDVSNYDELTFHIWSRNKKAMGVDYQLATDFAYKLKIASGKEYYIPTFKKFHHMVIDISDVNTITEITFTALHNDLDYINVSYMVATKDEIPRDIFDSVKSQLEYDINSFYAKITNGTANKGILLGTFTGLTGDNFIRIESATDFIDRYAVIFIEGGGNSETHQLESGDSVEFTFNEMYDGGTLLNDYTNANVYLTFPVEFGTSERQIILPGISIWGMAPEEIIRGNKEDNVSDTFKTSDESVRSRQEQANFKYTIQMNCEARHNELIAYMSQVVRTMIAREFIWIAGKKIDIKPEGPADFTDPIEAVSQIPKIAYLMSLEVKEEIYDRSTLVKADSDTITITPQTGTL